MTIGIPKEGIVSKIQDRFKSLARSRKLNGFRPGKIPMRLLEQRFGQQVREEVLNETIKTSFSEAIAQEKLHIVGEPNIDLNDDLEKDIKKLEEGLSYSATFEIYPEISVKNVDGLSIEKPIVTITESDIDKLLKRLQQQRQTWNDIDDQAAREGDRVTIDFIADINGKTFDGSEIKQVPVILGQKSFISAEFEEKLLGAVKGEQREFDLNFPEDYKSPKLAGQTVHFTVQVAQISEAQIPEIDAEFIKSFGIEDGKIESLRIAARQNMENELKSAIEAKLKQDIFDAVLKANPIEEVPESLVEEETQRILKMRQQEWQNHDLRAEMFQNEATKRVRIGLLVAELVKEHKIEADHNKVQQLIETITSNYKESEAAVKEYYADKEHLREVESVVVEDKLVAWLLDRAQITEKKTDYFSIIN
jgi:trigger factor